MPYNRNIYNLDPEKLAHWMIPVRWRGIKVVSWIKAMAYQWIDLYNRFVLYRKSVKYNLMITPQVCFLERALNDKYDPVQRRIYIEDGKEYLPVYIFRRDEEKPVYLKRREVGKIYLRSRREMKMFGVDFYVVLPLGETYNTDEMRVYLSGYKLATKTFTIRYE